MPASQQQPGGVHPLHPEPDTFPSQLILLVVAGGHVQSQHFFWSQQVPGRVPQETSGTNSEEAAEVRASRADAKIFILNTINLDFGVLGLIKSYAANTNQGIIREYNEDRVSIILNILKPKSKAHLNIEWPQICFFGVFDGHGGAACADYLRDNLHNFIV